MIKSIKLKPGYTFLFIVLALIIHNFIYVVSFKNSFPYDDAFIAYRYAENIANGEGWVYNSGEVSSGTTSYLNVGLNAGISYFLKTDAALSGRLLAIIFSSALLIFSTLVFSNIFNSRTFTGLYLLFFVLSPTIYNIGLSGMESSLFLTSLFIIILLIQNKYYYTSAVLTGLLLYLRIDALIFVAIYVIYIIISDNIRIRVKSIILMLILFLIASYFLFNYLLFNLFVPLSLYSKSIVFKDLGPIQDRFSVIYGFFRSKLIIVLLPASLAGLLIILKSREIKNLILTLFPFCWIIAYVVTNPWMREWYYFIPYPFLIFLSLYCIKSIHQITGLFKDFSTRSLKILQINLVAIFAIVLLISFIRQFNVNFGCTVKAPFNKSVIKTADFLITQESISDKTLFLGDIGYIGYKTKAKIIDYMGLVFPKSTMYLREKAQYSTGISISTSGLVALITDEEPDYLIFSNHYVFYQKLKEDNYILDNYIKLATKDTFDIWLKNIPKSY
jgi:arabinofuranosyltransferase